LPLLLLKAGCIPLLPPLLELLTARALRWGLRYCLLLGLCVLLLLVELMQTC
jgi:hypothetical protein